MPTLATPSDNEPQPKRKYHRRANKRVTPRLDPSPYEGMSGTNRCAFACRPDRCVITHAGNCGASNLLPHQNGDQAILRRFREAKDFLAHQKIDKRPK
jgi:hypothetical protein